MIKALDFPIVLLAAGLVAYLLAGGLGLLLTGLLGFIWRGGPFHTAWHGATTLMPDKTIRKLQERQALPPAGRPQHRFFLDIALCLVLIVVGVMRLESKGFIGPIG